MSDPTTHSTSQIIQCRIADQVIGLPSELVVEVLEEPKTAAIPRTPKFIVGVFIRKGEVIAQLDIQEWLGLSAVRAPRQKTIVVRFDRFIVGIQVDAVLAFAVPPIDEDSEARDLLTNRLNRLVYRTVRIDGESVALINVPALLEELQPRAMA